MILCFECQKNGVSKKGCRCKTCNAVHRNQMRRVRPSCKRCDQPRVKIGVIAKPICARTGVSKMKFKKVAKCNSWAIRSSNI